MSTCTRVTCGTCFYCDSPVSRHEHDHAPVPRRHDGTETVVACMMCHGLKDRHPLERWPLHLSVMAAVELADHGLTFDGSQVEWPSCWGDLTSHARILWAKCAAISADMTRRETFSPQTLAPKFGTR